MTQKLTISGSLTALNDYINAERANRFAAAKIKKAETERVAWSARVQKLKRTVGRVNLVFTWYEKNRRRDPDNVHFGAKFVNDGLVEAGILSNDSQKHIGSITHNPIKIDLHQPRVEVEICEHTGA